jgi:hypothetical protein
MGLASLILGLVILGFASLLDFGFRERMMQLGHKWALSQGGAFNYSRYHEVRKRHGWAAWPVCVMWALYVVGLALLIGGFFSYFGIAPSGHR